MPLSFPVNLIGPNPIVQSGTLFFSGGAGRIDLNRSIAAPFNADQAVGFAGRMPSDIAGVGVQLGQFISILPVTGGIGNTTHLAFQVDARTPNVAEIFANVIGLFVGPGAKGAAATITEYAGVTVSDGPVAGTSSGVKLNFTAGAGRRNLYCPGTADNSVAGKFYFAQDTLAIQSVCGFLAGTGVPNNANGANGDFYFRGDTPGTVAQRIYIKSAGAWVALAI